MKHSITHRLFSTLCLLSVLVLGCPGDEGGSNTGGGIDRDTGVFDGSLDASTGDSGTSDSGLGDANSGSDATQDSQSTDIGGDDAVADTQVAGDVGGEDAGGDLGTSDSGGEDAASDTGGTDTADDVAVDMGPSMTLIRVHFDAGVENSVALRGDTSPLSWDDDFACEWSEGNIWLCEVVGLVIAEIQLKPVWLLPNDEFAWALGSDYLVVPGETVDVYPYFDHTVGTVYRFDHDDRGVDVYVPPGYDQWPDRRYPVFVMFDGQNVFDEIGGVQGGWSVDDSLDQLIVYGNILQEGQDALSPGSIAPPIVVAPHNAGGDRYYEYTPEIDGCVGDCGGGGDEHLDWIEQDLLVALRSDGIPGQNDPVPFRGDDERMTIGGSSLGGLMSFHACWSRPETYERCAVLSPSLWYSDEWTLDQVSAAVETPDLQVYIDAGTGEQEGTVTRIETLTGLLTDSEGHAMTLVEGVWCLVGDGGHNEGAWRYRVPFALAWLFADNHRVHALPMLPDDLSQCGE